ncbi:MAG: hypothetical protein HQK87_11050, partial [Nitrospinae bacterium]|nr:hypothetical protein [Nitrospinota bacterium]
MTIVGLHRSLAATVAISIALLLLFASPARAEKDKKGIEPGIYPALNLSYDYDTNIYRLSEDRVQIE